MLWENVAYLASDEKRAKAFAQLKKTVGLSPSAVLAAADDKLLAVTRYGVIAPLFARKLRLAAELADDLGGNVDRALDSDLKRASKQLRAFPGIGEPGAERILVAIGRARTLPLESNGLRVLLRLGLGQSLKSYGATYRAVKAALPIGRASGKSLFATSLLLQRHGRTVCKTAWPQCSRCTLRTVCAFAERNHSGA